MPIVAPLGKMSDHLKRYQSQLGQALEGLQHLGESALDLADAAERAAALQGSVDFLTNALGFHGGLIAETQGREALVMRQLSGMRTDAFRGLFVQRGFGLGGKVLALGRIEWVDDYLSDRSITPRFDWEVAPHEVISSEGLLRWIAAPLIGPDHDIIGVLWGAFRDRGTFGSRSVEAMERAATSAVAAIGAADRAARARAVAVHDDRRRIAMQLHDTVGALLFTIGAKLNELGESLDTQPSLKEQASLIQRHALEASAALRESLQALHATPGDLVLSVVLTADCRSFEERTGIPTRLVMLADSPLLAGSRAEAIVTAVREALLNVEKHAEASSVLVTIGQTDSEVVAVVTDDGSGYQPARDGHPGLGLAGIEERLQRVGGHLTVRANDDVGTTFRAAVPR